MTESKQADSPGPFLAIVVGPTASAKSELAAKMAQELGGEVVSADSVQVYRHFDIGAGKPSEEERALAPHHLLDIRDPLDPIEASVWAELALQKVREIMSRGKIPIVCGGTFLWVRALVYGLAQTPAGDAAIRERHNGLAAEKGRDALHQMLRVVDPKSAERLHPNDLVRVSRALEVHELTGQTLSELQAEHGFRKPRFEAQLLGIGWEKEAYESRLRRRTQLMMERGFRGEVERLIAQGYQEARAMDAVGYRQVRDAVLGVADYDGSDDVALLEDIIRVTRIFARRQRTWLRDEPVRYVATEVLDNAGALSSLCEEVRHRSSTSLE